jgi:hypothetical protein
MRSLWTSLVILAELSTPSMAQSGSKAIAGTWILSSSSNDCGSVDGFIREPRVNPYRLSRVQNALRDIVETSARLHIDVTSSTVIVTSSDGHTNRLAPGGGTIKDESAGISRKTAWNGDELVTEITGILEGRIAETFSVDISHRLHFVLRFPRKLRGVPISINRIYCPSESN